MKTTTTTDRLNDIIRVLEARALDGSAALPAGRGGVHLRNRNESIRLLAVEARQILDSLQTEEGN